MMYAATIYIPEVAGDGGGGHHLAEEVHVAHHLCFMGGGGVSELEVDDDDLLLVGADEDAVGSVHLGHTSVVEADDGTFPKQFPIAREPTADHGVAQTLV